MKNTIIFFSISLYSIQITERRQSISLHVKGMKHPWKIVDLVPLPPLVRFLLLRVLLITSNKIHIDAPMLLKCDSFVTDFYHDKKYIFNYGVIVVMCKTESAYNYPIPNHVNIRITIKRIAYNLR